MAEMSKLSVGGTTYDIKDSTARAAIASLEGGMKYLGVTTTALTDGATTNPITIDEQSVSVSTGNVVIYDNKEFVFDGTKWDEFGDLSTLGNLAYKNTASGTFTPSGSVTLTEVTTPVNSLTSAGTLPSSSYDSVTETLSISWGSLPTASSTTVLAGASASFSGTQGNINVS